MGLFVFYFSASCTEYVADFIRVAGASILGKQRACLDGLFILFRLPEAFKYGLNRVSWWPQSGNYGRLLPYVTSQGPQIETTLHGDQTGIDAVWLGAAGARY
jgi:hypothetical protein